jgi:hypothetical protein
MAAMACGLQYDADNRLVPLEGSARALAVPAPGVPPLCPTRHRPLSGLVLSWAVTIGRRQGELGSVAKLRQVRGRCLRTTVIPELVQHHETSDTCLQ